MDRGAWRATVHGVKKSQVWLSDWAGTRAVYSSQPLSRVRLLATPWTVAHQAPMSMGFSRQEYWSGLPFPSPHNVHMPMLFSHFVLHPFPLYVYKSVLYAWASIPVLHFSRIHIYISLNIWYLFYSFWLTSFCMTTSRFIHIMKWCLLTSQIRNLTS